MDHLPTSIDSILQKHNQVFVKQEKEWIEIVVDFETKNKYAFYSTEKKLLGWIAERAGGILSTLVRLVARSHRPLEIDVIGTGSSPLLTLSRKFFFFFSDLFVKSPDGAILGSVHRRFGILYKKYDLRDESGQTFARVKSPLWRLWTFPIYDLVGSEKGRIAKRWGGGLREIFTDADSYLVDFGSTSWSNHQKAVVFAAAVSIDFDFFENNQGKSGGLFGD